jgi:diguanylate cyclase (GGDEF)-like protein
VLYSLFYVLNNQHVDDFAPVRCNAQTVTRLVRYFEDVVAENKLSALVIQGRCLDGDPTREAERFARLSLGSRQMYVFSCDPSCMARKWHPEKLSNVITIEEPNFHSIESGPFILVMDPRFCGLLASYRLPDVEGHPSKGYEMIWTFDPNVVFTALEYLMARISVQRPGERQRLESLLNTCTTRTSSTRMALTFTTKLAMLLQRQNDLETAINSISSAISSTLDLDTILQSAVEEVGRAMKSRRAALVLWEEDTKRPEKMNVYEREGVPEQRGTAEGAEARRDGGGPAPTGSLLRKNAHKKGDSASLSPPGIPIGGEIVIPGPLEVPIVYSNKVTGVLQVEDDTPGRQWENEEVLMVRTASDQLAVAISHARLLNRVQAEAATDALTSLYNHRYFKERLEREVRLAERNRGPVSLILLDLDRLKRINDTFGHRAGDDCLIHVASAMKAAVREVDICARYGGEEFVVILPQCGRDDALVVAERLRAAIAVAPVAKVGQLTASVGVATYPVMATSMEELIEMADRAMYLAKASGRNAVRTVTSLD